MAFDPLYYLRFMDDEDADNLAAQQGAAMEKEYNKAMEEAYNEAMQKEYEEEMKRQHEDYMRESEHPHA